MVEAAAGEKKPDKRQHPAVHAKDAMKVFDKVLKQSKTGAKGTHVRALMNPNSPQFNAKVKAAWDQLKKEERDEILRKQVGEGERACVCVCVCVCVRSKCVRVCVRECERV